ncbi:MAG: hypothetical protein ACI9GB_002690, partial [Halioglobus sp.]
FEGQALHPASEGRFFEEYKIFRCVRYGVVDTIAIHKLLLFPDQAIFSQAKTSMLAVCVFISECTATVYATDQIALNWARKTLPFQPLELNG